MSDFFTLDEFLRSDTAKAHGIANYPTWAVVANLRRLATTMERVRDLTGNMPITITSGYRCPELNMQVGGAKDSAHLSGLACDFVVPAFGDPLAVCKALEPHMEALEIDQLIWEFEKWVHLGLSYLIKPRAQRLTINSSGTRTGFA